MDSELVFINTYEKQNRSRRVKNYDQLSSAKDDESAFMDNMVNIKKEFNFKL
jgi:hypothetical protein